MYHFLLVITEKSEIVNMQILRIFKKLFQCFDWQKAFMNKNTNEKTWILTDTLINIFKNFICIKLKN